MEKGGSVYILTNETNKVLYTGVTSDLPSRIWKHRNKFYPNSFSSKYGGLYKLVYVERFHSIEETIAREKQIKGYARFKKIRLIEKINYEWRDLVEQYQ